MRIIPKKTKVSTEFFRGVSIADMVLGFLFVIILFLVFISTLPFRYWLDLGLLFVFGFLLVRIDDEPNYMFFVRILRHFSFRRRYQKIDPIPREEGGDPTLGMSPKERKAYRKHQKEIKKAEAKRRKFEKKHGLSPEDADHPEQEPLEGLDSTDASPSDPGEEPPPLSKQEEKKAAQTKARQDKKERAEEKRRQKQEQRAKKLATKAAKRAKKAEDRFLKNKKIPQEAKADILERRRREADQRYYEAKIAEQKRNRLNIEKLYLITDIHGGFINYGNQYYGAAIEIPPVEFRFFSPHRRSNAIDRALGNVIRSIGPNYAANLVKLERPMVLDQYIQGEYDKIDALKRSYERDLINEEELQARVEVLYDRIYDLERYNTEEQVLVPHYYLVLFDSDRRQLENQVNAAMSSLSQGEMSPHRLNDQELALFLRYSNGVDFDEREIQNVHPDDYVHFALPQSVEIKQRTVEVNSVITHNFRVIRYPLEVDDAWGASLFDLPGTKMVMKFSQMDREKSIRAIDRSISELNSQLEKTGVSSRVLELETHIQTLSELLVMLQNNNEALMSVNLYVTAYDMASTRANKLLVPQPPPSPFPQITNMKKGTKRTFQEQGFRLSDLSFQQFEAFVATQVNGYDPFAKLGRGMPSGTAAAVFPWIYASLSDPGGLNLGSCDGVPTFLDFFRRDHERVNSNMVIVGKSGGGKSYATKSILSNLAADDSKIFVLDPENEYTELAANLKGKFINVANASHGRINPFHIITSLEDDEAQEGVETSSYATHLQFLEEFFRQILPDIDGDAMEYLNNLINRIYSQKGIDTYTNLTRLKPEDYPIFDDLYDCILEEFQRTKSDYLKSNLRVLMNYIAKFSTGGRNASIWNGPSSLSTVENFIVFNFQALLANRNQTIANAQMLLVLKYLDNEIIKNREYNQKYHANRKVIVVIDEAHVFIDAKYPLALDFMFQLAKRIRKYNGMQIVITQNIKDFVGSEELSRKSTAIINACQYSFIFSLAPNDMHDLCKLYEKAGGINQQEQEQIISAARGQAFVVTGPTHRSTMQIVTPKPIEELFSQPDRPSRYFCDEAGWSHWEELVAQSRQRREYFQAQRVTDSQEEAEADLPNFRDRGISIIEVDSTAEMDAQIEELLLTLEEDEAPVADQLPAHMKQQAMDALISEEDNHPFSPQSLQRYGFEALLGEIRRTVRQEVENELHQMGSEQPAPVFQMPQEVQEPQLEQSHVPLWSESSQPVPPEPTPPESDPFSVESDFWSFSQEPVPPAAPFDRWQEEPEDPSEPSLDDLFADLFAPSPQEEEDPSWVQLLSQPEPEPEPPEDSSQPAQEEEELDLDALLQGAAAVLGEEVEPESEELPEMEPMEEPSPWGWEDLPLVYEVTLEQLLAMEDPVEEEPPAPPPDPFFPDQPIQI